jgi:hypothetical protein
MWHYVNWAALLTVQYLKNWKYETVRGESHLFGISATSLWCAIHDKDCSKPCVKWAVLWTCKSLDHQTTFTEMIEFLISEDFFALA